MNMGGINTMYIWALYDQQWPDFSSNSGLDPFKGEFFQGVQIVGYLYNIRQTTKPQYPWYSVAMLTKHIGEGNVLEGDRNGNVYASAINRNDNETTVVVTCYDEEETDIEVSFEKSFEGKTFYKYVYDTKNITPTPEIEMIKCSETKENVTDKITDKLSGYCVVVYTTAKPE